MLLLVTTNLGYISLQYTQQREAGMSPDRSYITQ